jgi:hypothetical protein
LPGSFDLLIEVLVLLVQVLDLLLKLLQLDGSVRVVVFKAGLTDYACLLFKLLISLGFVLALLFET